MLYNFIIMSATHTTEYNVHLSQQAVNGTEIWQASVESLPDIHAEGESCDAVLQEIGRKLRQRADNGDIVLVTHAAEQNLSAQELAELRAEAEAKGHKLFGIFQDDPRAMEVFDEIERQRHQQTIGG